jgi:hypothetical protein
VVTFGENLQNLTRRTVLGWGAAVAVARIFRRRTGRSRTARQIVPAFILSGGANAHGILVHSTLSPADTDARVDLAVWRADGTGQPTLVGEQVADGDAIVRHRVVGMEPDTAYYARLVDQGEQVGERVRFKTLPALGRSWTRSIAVVSCQSNLVDPSCTDLAWRDLLAWGPDDVWHLGDWGYWGGSIPGHASYKEDLAWYRRCLRIQPTIRRAIQAADLNVVTISDHELSTNGDPPGGIHDCPQSIRELVAFQKLFPVRAYGDTRRPRRGRYYFFDIGSAVRVIVTDFRSPDRSNIGRPDGPMKTMFGATQLAWLLDRLDSSRVNLIVNETSWLADPDGRPTDKPWTYFHEQNVIASHIQNGGFKVAWIGGDRHYLGYLKGADDGSGVYNTLGGFPCYISSGTAKNQLELAPGELMTWQFGAGSDGRPVCGYLRLVLGYDHETRVVTLQAHGRAVLDTTQPMSQWVIDDVPGGTASDSWQVPS